MLDARGQVPAAYGNKKNIVEETIEDAQNFLKGDMFPWSEMLDLDGD